MKSKKIHFISHLFLFVIVMVTIIVSCEKKVSAPGVENQSSATTSTTSGSTTGGTTTGGGTGQGMFWIQSDLGCGSITVVISGVSKTITNYYSSGSPACGSSGCATYNLSPGTYAYTASCTGYTWGTGSPSYITITSGGCSKMQLY